MDDVGEGLRCTHKLAPPVSGDVDGVAHTDLLPQTELDRRHVDVRFVHERLAKVLAAVAGHNGLVSFRELRSDLASLSEAIRVNARALQEDNRVSGRDVTAVV